MNGASTIIALSWKSASEVVVIMVPLTNNAALGRLGSYLRPLLSEAGRVLGLEDAGFIGICFPILNQDESKILFAEYVNQRNQEKTYDESEYILPAQSAFVRAIINSARDNRVWRYAASADEPACVVEPLAKEFPNATSPHAIFSQYCKKDAADDAILYFIAGSEDIFNTFPGKLETAKSFLIKTLIDALFLAATTEPQLHEWSDRLRKRLPEEFPFYRKAQQSALVKVRHPYLQHLQIHEHEIQPPEIAGKYEPKDESFLTAAGVVAEKLHVIRLLSGSFQNHNVYSVNVFPRGNAKNYEAAIKRANQAQAEKEVTGYFSLLPYFREIRNVMPSAPLIFHTDKKEGNGEVGTKENIYAVLTPHLGGESLYEYVKNMWANRTVDEVVKLSNVFTKLRVFIDSIRPPSGPEETVEPFTHLYESHLAPHQRMNGGRFTKTRKELERRLPEGLEDCPMLEVYQNVIPNPLWTIINAPLEGNRYEIESFWHTSRRSRRIVRFGHGDFHVGNILYSRADERVTVLDFDYVGSHHEHEDPATLEASFILAVAASPSFKDREAWSVGWPDTLKFLTGDLSYHAIENNRLAHDVVHLVSLIRKKQIDDSRNHYMADDCHYHACLATALLRLFTSHSKTTNKNHFRPVGATALLWLGLLLQKICKSQDKENAKAIDLFTALR